MGTWTREPSVLSNAKNHRTFLKGPLTARPPRPPSPTRSGSTPAGCPGETSLVFEVTVFKGLPYAATTAGANRRRPPQRAASWTGVRVADTFGDICPQQLMGSASVTMSEDCLHLNGWVKLWTCEQALAGGHLNDVPVLADGNKDENGASPTPTVKLADYLSTAEKEYGTLAFLKLYPATTGTEAGQARTLRPRGIARLREPVGGAVGEDAEEPGLHVLLGARPADRDRRQLPWRLPRFGDQLRLRQPLRHEPALDRRGPRGRRHPVRPRGELRDPRRPERPWPHPLARGEPPLSDHHGTRRPLWGTRPRRPGQGWTPFARFFASQKPGGNSVRRRWGRMRCRRQGRPERRDHREVHTPQQPRQPPAAIYLTYATIW